MLDHEYSILGGLNRAKIGHVIGVAAAVIASAMLTVFLALVNVAQHFGYGDKIPNIVMWPVSAGVVYAALYWWFDRFCWKFPFVAKWLKVPDLAGEWDVKGQTLNADKTPSYPWIATITITQSWDRIRVRLKTAQSGSNSIAAALLHDPVDGFRILYNYKNDPNIDEPELAPHHGFADLTFSRDLKSARGEYFNGHGRFTFGTMALTRKL